MDRETEKPGQEGTSRKTLAKSIFLALLAGIVINAFIGLLVDYGELFSAFSNTSIATLIVPFLAIIVIYIIDSYRFKYVFSKFGIRLSFRDSFYDNIIGNFFSGITPGSVGGQPFQVLHFSRLGIDSAIASNVIFSRLIEGNFVQLIIVIIFFKNGIGMMAGLGKGSFLLSAGMVATVVMTIVLLLAFLNPYLLGILALRMEKSWLGRLITRMTKNPAWAEKLSVWSQGLSDGFKVLWKNNTHTIVIDILATGVTQTIWALSLYLPVTVLTGVATPFPEFLISYCLCGLISLFIPTPGGSGSVEASYLLVLSALTGKPAATMSAILLWRVGTYYLQLLLGSLVYIFVKVPKNVYAKDKDGIMRHVRKPRVPKRTAVSG
ncbi:MAG: lysylphosphatidylglycerol synthase transmembrane domain-containing protein [Spirochaetes bacterium]|nr:lysylphosphatidylglycerol synthase transmembrane domain-containing protein [Spirochaetota bacterium]